VAGLDGLRARGGFGLNRCARLLCYSCQVISLLTSITQLDDGYPGAAGL
jgi:hypothetical protein